MLQETLLSAISIVDQFLAVEGRSVTRSKLQLVGVAAMFLASKVEEVFAPACSIHFLRRFFKAGDVDVLQRSLAKYAIELALVEYDLVPVPGSKLAASVLCLSHAAGAQGFRSILEAVT